MSSVTIPALDAKSVAMPIIRSTFGWRSWSIAEYSAMRSSIRLLAASNTDWRTRTLGRGEATKCDRGVYKYH